MKKAMCLLTLLISFLVIPFGVYAKDDNNNDKSNKVNVYLFYGNGCPHCEEAEAWFKTIEKEHGDKYNLVSYEVWYNEDNNNLMQAVGKVRDENVTGVPYIIVGNQTWNGFDSSYATGILEKIDSEYSKKDKERYDIMDYVDLKGIASNDSEASFGHDAVILIIILFGVGAIAAGIIMARNSTN